MKEYLTKNIDGGYTIVNHKFTENDIEVPDGANIYVAVFNNNFFYKDNFKYTYRDKWVETAYCGINLEIRQKMPVLWQRHTQPEELPFMDSLNDQYAEIERVRQSGMKFDSNKPRHSLLPKGAVNSVIKVLEFGAKKYDADNWQKVDNAEERYYNAAMRHIDSWWNGEKCDPETGSHHLAHAATNLFFLMWFDNK